MRLRLSVPRVWSLSVVAVLSPLLLAAPAQAQGALWTVVASPNATPGNNDLAAVATVSASDAWAVGSAENSLGNDQLLAEHRAGSAAHGHALWTLLTLEIWQRHYRSSALQKENLACAA